MGAPTELDADIPAGLGPAGAPEQEIRNDFTRLSRTRMRVGAGRAFPFISIRDRHQVSSHRRRSVRTFLDIELIEVVPRRRLPVEYEAILKWEPDFTGVEVFNSDLMLNRAMSGTNLPLPGQAQMRRGCIVDEADQVFIRMAVGTVELPLNWHGLGRDLYAGNQSFGSAVVPGQSAVLQSG